MDLAPERLLFGRSGRKSLAETPWIPQAEPIGSGLACTC